MLFRSLYGWNNQFAQAQEAFQKALNLDDTNIAAIVHLARMDIIKKDYVKARSFLQDKLEEFPQNPLIMAEISDTYLFGGNIIESLSWTSKAYALANNNYYILSKYANALTQSEQLEKAIETVDFFYRPKY